MSKAFNRLMKNSLANIVNGFSSVILGIVISPFLVRTLSVESFSVWSLLLQIGALFALLGFGSQLAVGRFITETKIKDSSLDALAVLKNALLITFIGIGIGGILIFIIHHFFGLIFPDIDGALLYQAKIGFLYITFAYLVNVLSSVAIGYFVGLERNDIPAVINIIFRTLQGVGLVISAQYGLIIMATLYLAINIISCFVLFYLVNKQEALTAITRVDGSANFKVYVKYCAGLAVWNLSMLLVSGVDNIVIGRYDFSAVGIFAIASMFVTAYVGFIGAGVSPLIQPLIKLYKEEKHQSIERIMLVTTLLIFSINCIAILFTMTCSETILTLLYGEKYSPEMRLILILLVAVNALRLAGSSFSIVILSQSKHGKIALYPLLEGSLNLLFSLILVQEYGVYGVIAGTCIAAFIIMVIYSVKVMPMLLPLTASLRNRILMFNVLPFLYLAIILLLSKFAGVTLLTNSVMAIVLIFSVIILSKNVCKLKNEIKGIA